MLSAPNGMPRRATLGMHAMPPGYELWVDEDGYYWWHHNGPPWRQSEPSWDKWWVWKNARADAKQNGK